MPLILAFGRQRQVGLCKFNASLGYIESSRIARATEILSQTNKQTNQTTIRKSTTIEAPYNTHGHAYRERI